MTEKIASFHKSSGAIHFVALFACVLFVAAIFYMSRWVQKANSTNSRISAIEKSVENLETKIKYLELRLASDELVDSKLLKSNGSIR